MKENGMPKTVEKHTNIYWVRVDQIINLLLENPRYLQSKRNNEVISVLKEKYAIEERTAYRYLEQAKREIRRIGKLKTHEAVAQALRDREYLLAKTRGERDKEGNWVTEPDLRLHLEVLRDRDKLLGLYEERVRQTGDVVFKNIDLTKFTEYGLELISKGSPVEEVLKNPAAVKEQEKE